MASLGLPANDLEQSRALRGCIARSLGGLLQCLDSLSKFGLHPYCCLTWSLIRTDPVPIKVSRSNSVYVLFLHSNLNEGLWRTFFFDQCRHSLLRVTTERRMNATSGEYVLELGFAESSRRLELCSGCFDLHRNRSYCPCMRRRLSA